jgi:hypothetical protein
MNQIENMVRYTREFTLSMFAYVLVLVASNSILLRLQGDRVGPLQVLVALAPVAPVVFILRAILRLLVTSDELQQRVQLSAIAFAAVSTALLTFAYGFLEGIGFPHLSPTWILPGMTLLWGLGVGLYSRNYR